MKHLRMLLFLFCGGFAPTLFAQQSSLTPVVDEVREAELAQKAKKRLYPGGRDEEDLRVQAELLTPTRKVTPQAEVKEEPAEE
jgi:hypothetical protein